MGACVGKLFDGAPSKIQLQQRQRTFESDIEHYNNVQFQLNNNNNNAKQQTTLSNLDGAAKLSIIITEYDVEPKQNETSHKRGSTDLINDMPSPLIRSAYNLLHSPSSSATTYRSHGRSARSRHTRNTCTQVLSTQQIMHVKTSWTVVQQYASLQSVIVEPAIGFILMRRLIECHPSLCQVLQLPECLENVTSLAEDHPFNQHVRILASFIDLMVRNCDELEAQIGPAAIMYGRKHSRRQQDGFQLTHMRWLVGAVLHIVREALEFDQQQQQEQTAPEFQQPLDAVTRAFQLSETLEAWTKLMVFVEKKFHEGFEFEILHGDFNSQIELQRTPSRSSVMRTKSDTTS